MAHSGSEPPTIQRVPPYNVGDIVYLDDRPHQITELRDDTVQLLPTGMSYPIYRAESRERFEQLLREDNRNDFYTEFLLQIWIRWTRTFGMCWPMA